MPSTIDAVNRFLDAKILYGRARPRTRGRGHLGPRDVAEQHAPLLEPGGGGPAPPRHHESIHKACWDTAERFGTPGNYVNAPHRGLPQGRQRDDGSGRV